MKQKIKTRKGFIQIPILIAIIVGVIAIGGVTYVGIKQYKINQAEEFKKQQDSSTQTPLPSTSEQKPLVPNENVPYVPNQSQILEDQANRALLESLYNQDDDEAVDYFYKFNDAWRENPVRNCRNDVIYSYEIAQAVMGNLEDDMLKKYGKSRSWREVIEVTFKSWCLDKGY